MKIYVARVLFPVTALGPGKRAGIWFTGCDRHCPECISPELWNMNYGRETEPEELARFMETHMKNIEGFSISGGEPFYQSEGLKLLLEHLIKINRDIIIFTGYTAEELQKSGDPAVRDIMDMASLIVAGPYVPEQNNGMGLRGSSNQEFLIRGHQYQKDELEHYKRKLQLFSYGNQYIEIGIP